MCPVAGVIVVHVSLPGRLGGSGLDQRQIHRPLRKRRGRRIHHRVGARNAARHSSGRRGAEPHPRLESRLRLVPCRCRRLGFPGLVGSARLRWRLGRSEQSVPGSLSAILLRGESSLMTVPSRILIYGLKMGVAAGSVNLTPSSLSF